MPLPQSSFTPPRKLGTIKPRADEQAPESASVAIEAVITPINSPAQDIAVPKDPTEVKVETAGSDVEQPHSTDTPESPVDETTKATSSRRGRPKKEKNDSAASSEPKYVITTGKA